MTDKNAQIIKLVDVKHTNKKKKYLITAADWKLWWAENKMKKECAERKKRKFTKLELKIIFIQIKDATNKAMYADERKGFNA
tara:strand:- start:1372 stop:1617 length:246 start_codon:yes stop_codon:yes gene_type:complete